MPVIDLMTIPDAHLRLLEIRTSDPQPIWSQIEQGILRLVASGELASGDPAPSVREMALSLRVNPATVSKAYQRLVSAGVLEVRRGDGTYVSSAPPSLKRSEQKRLLRDAAYRFASFALTHGADRKEAREALDDAFDDLTEEKGRTT